MSHEHAVPSAYDCLPFVSLPNYLQRKTTASGATSTSAAKGRSNRVLTSSTMLRNLVTDIMRPQENQLIVRSGLVSTQCPQYIAFAKQGSARISGRSVVTSYRRTVEIHM